MSRTIASITRAPWPSRSRSSRKPPERPVDVEVIQTQEVPALALEPDRLAPGEELERPPEAGSEAARPAGHRGEAAEIAGVEAHQPIVLAEVAGPQDDGRRPEERHGQYLGGGLRPPFEAPGAVLARRSTAPPRRGADGPRGKAAAFAIRRRLRGLPPPRIGILRHVLG